MISERFDVVVCWELVAAAGTETPQLRIVLFEPTMHQVKHVIARVAKSLHPMVALTADEVFPVENFLGVAPIAHPGGLLLRRGGGT